MAKNKTTMKYPTTRFVFDRKKTATKTKDALVQVEILHERKKKYVSTGVKLYKDQWSDKQHAYRRDDAPAMNERMDAVKGAIDGYLNTLIKNGKPFSWEGLELFLKLADEKKQTFIDYVAQRISERNDIRESTRKAHAKLLSSLDEYGRITTWEQLTRPNIAGYYDWLLGRTITKIGPDGKEYTAKMSQQTIAGYMKLLRVYIHDAIAHDRIEHDPSIGVKVKRGETLTQRWLTLDEVSKIEKAELSGGSLVRVRDLFIFCCYSGLAFSDLMDFSPEKIEKNGDDMILSGKRIKTGQEYVVLILPKAKEILEKYDYRLPKYSNQQFNARLKTLAKEAGINKPLTTHWSRHTAGMMLLNKGVRIETVAKILGHSSIRITEQVYASILRKTVVDEMKEMAGK